MKRITLLAVILLILLLLLLSVSTVSACGGGFACADGAGQAVTLLSAPSQSSANWVPSLAGLYSLN